MLTAGADKIAKLWNLTTGAMDRPFLKRLRARCALLRVEERPARRHERARIKPCASTSSADASECRRPSRPPGEVRVLGFTPNNLALVVGTVGKTLDAWSTPFTPAQPPPKDFLTPVQSFTTADLLSDFTIAADNASIYSAGQDKAMHVWKLASPAPTRSFNYGTNVDAVAFQPNSNLLPAPLGHDGKLRLFDLAKNAQVKDITAHIRDINKQQIAQPI